ncbi:uncharacterized protein LOC132760405 [Ruditapes philippinarum]|uniref:uncharacterized protein LOC132760405 n=1 Tax=Ruditapes philippinarum TaxID=129788 RepID=UPI00295A9EF3|nr:uncharacterized protein LOC132760405 [Ruditapes philippinarum]XP_060608363.1 uncharacterized protein LOC132760405 [Ruditapes philippinarum]
MSLTPEQCEDFWRIADRNGDGVLSIQELAAAARKYRPGISDKDCTCMFCGIDKNGDGSITKQEFLAEMRDKPKRSETLLQLFKKYDKDGSGTLTKNEVSQLIRECFKQNKKPDEIVETFMQYSDTSGDGVISWEEFKDFFG